MQRTTHAMEAGATREAQRLAKESNGRYAVRRDHPHTVLPLRDAQEQWEEGTPFILVWPDGGLDSHTMKPRKTERRSETLSREAREVDEMVKRSVTARRESDRKKDEAIKEAYGALHEAALVLRKGPDDWDPDEDAHAAERCLETINSLRVVMEVKPNA